MPRLFKPTEQIKLNLRGAILEPTHFGGGATVVDGATTVVKG